MGDAEEGIRRYTDLAPQFRRLFQPEPTSLGYLRLPPAGRFYLLILSQSDPRRSLRIPAFCPKCGEPAHLVPFSYCQKHVFGTTFPLSVVILCCTLFLESSSGLLSFYSASGIFFAILETGKCRIASSSRNAPSHRQGSSRLPRG